MREAATDATLATRDRRIDDTPSPRFGQLGQRTRGREQLRYVRGQRLDHLAEGVVLHRRILPS